MTVATPIASAPNDQQAYTLPAEFGDKYTDDDIAIIKNIYTYLNDHPEHTKSWVAKRANIPEGTLASVLSGKYIAPPSAKLQQIYQATLRSTERDLSGINEKVLVETTVFKQCWAMFITAQREYELTLVTGVAGIGKTATAKEFVAKNADAIYIRALPDMQPVTLLKQLIEISGAIIKKNGYSKDAMLYAVIEAFAKRDAVLLIDEAENMRDGCFEELRVLRDEAQVGICLIGELALHDRLKRKEKFNKFESRIGPSTGRILGISRKDSDAIVNAHFDDVDAKTKAAFWKVSSGSARRLEEKVCRKIKSRKLLNDRQLSPALVDAVSKQLLRD